MKTMNDFSAFRLNKNQMGAMKGGAKCTLTYDNGYKVTLTNDEMTKGEAAAAVSGMYGGQFNEYFGLQEIECTD